MVELSAETEKAKSKAAVYKISILLLFIASAIFLVQFTELTQYLTDESLGTLLDQTGSWSPLAFIFIYTAGVLLFIPGPVLTAVGAALFGPYWGFLYVYLGALCGASLAFFISRTLGRDFAASIVRRRLRRYDEAIARNGFATVLYLRLIYSPFSPTSFGMGLTKVRFVPYFFATALGIIVGTFLLTFSIGTITDVWISGQWDQLLSQKVLFSLGLFVLSFFIPVIVKRLRKL